MNIATGKLDAPIVKKAGLLDPATVEGVLGGLKSLATSKGLLGASAPLDNYALSAGLGAGTAEATKRLLQNRFGNNPKLLKALSLATGYSAGGGAGLAASLASPLAPVVSRGSGSQAARSLAELTAIGTGAELAASPFLAAALKSGNPEGAVKTLGKMFGGGAITSAGVLARDKRNVDNYIQAYLSGGLPRGIPRPDLRGGAPTLLELAKARKDYLKKVVPEGSLLALGGAGLLASGNPLLGASALLSAPMANKRVSRYIGDVAKELSSAKKTKDSLDSLYKKSSVKLAAPVYVTMPYCLDAPTMEKVAFMGLVERGIGKALNFVSGVGKGTGQQVYNQGSRLLSTGSRQSRRQGRDLLRANIDRKVLEADPNAPLNPEFLRNQQIIQDNQGFNPIKSFTRARAKRRQAFTPTYEASQAQVDAAAAEIRRDASAVAQDLRTNTQRTQQMAQNAPGARGTTDQLYTRVDPTNPATRPNYFHGTNKPFDADVSAIGAQKDYYKRLEDLRRRSSSPIRNVSSGSTRRVNTLNPAEQAELAQLEHLTTQYSSAPLGPSGQTGFHEFVQGIRNQQGARDAVTARAGEMQQIGQGASDALTRTGGEGSVGQTLRKLVRRSTYSNRGRGGSAANLEERLLRESGDSALLEFTQGAGGRAGALRQGTEAAMRSAANKVGLGQTTAALRSEANNQLKRFNLPANQQEQVMRAYEEHMVTNKGVFDPKLFQQEVAKVTGAELDSAGKLVGTSVSQAIPGMREITTALGDQALNKTRSSFSTAMNKYVQQVRTSAGQDLAKTQTTALENLSTGVNTSAKRFAGDPAATESIANIEALSREIESLHTLHNSSQGREILEVVNATLKDKTTSAEQIGKLRRSLSDYLSGKKVEFELPAQRGAFGNKATSRAGRKFEADINTASPELREAFQKRVQYGEGSATKARDAAFSAEGLGKETLTPEGSLLTDATAHMADDIEKLRVMASQGGGNKKLADRLMKGEVTSVESLSLAERQALEVVEFAPRNPIDAVNVASNNIISNPKGIEHGLRKARDQVKDLRAIRQPTTAQQELQAHLETAISEVTAHYAPSGAGGAGLASLNANLNTARNNAYSFARRRQGIGVVEQSSEALPEVAEAAQSPSYLRSLVGAAGLTGAVVAGTRGGGKGTATKAREKALKSTPTASWGLSPLHAPVAYRKKVASQLTPPISFKPQEFKPVDANKVQAGASPTTATTASTDTALRRLRSSSMLSAPVGY